MYISKSCISSAETDWEITRIVEQSRANNGRLDVTGVLVFDGVHFAQFIEGPKANVQALRSAIESDSRHQDVTNILFDSGATRQLPDWSLAYAGRSLVIQRVIRRAARDIKQGQLGAGERLLAHLITLSPVSWARRPAICSGDQPRARRSSTLVRKSASRSSRAPVQRRACVSCCA